MDGIAAKIAKKIAVLLQHHSVDSRPAEEVPQHHAGGTAADYATPNFQDTPLRPCRIV